MALQVAVGLGFVIFVHELGHFAVAKWCGVRCDKFFIGFDIGGYKLSRTWGETEYGIGILPLGGYVKMFGQDDNVANIEEEIRQTEITEGSPEAVEIQGPDGKKHWVHRRSYLAKNVPQRMAIISAGVIMNVIFAFIFAWFAYGLGVPKQPAVISSTTPGGPAWGANLHAGDQIIQLNDIKNPTYAQLHESVIFGDKDSDLECTIQRMSGETTTITLTPDRSGKLPKVGVMSPVALRLPLQGEVINENSPAVDASGAGFENGDLIVALNGVEVANYAELARELIKYKQEPVTYTLLRGAKAPKSNPFGPLSGGDRVETTVDPNPMERLGIVPTLGPIRAIQTDSPAASSELQVGDLIIAVNGVAIGAADEGQESWDPTTLDDRLASLAQQNEEVTLTVERAEETLELSIMPRKPEWPDRAASKGDPFPLTSLGIACDLYADVEAIVAGSPADEAGLLKGDMIVSAKLTSSNEESEFAKQPFELAFSSAEPSWPLLLTLLQDNDPDFLVELTLKRGEEKVTKQLKPEKATDTFQYVRGIKLTPLKATT